MKGWELVVFSGPSLPPREAKRLARGRMLPPARQGDLYRVLPRQPRAIALIDGLFESVPSVWHREILAALDAGVAVFGASSMGALRAGELASFGMVGIGRVHGWVLDGTVQDDADVALLHADEEHGYRPLTLPLVTVRHVCDLGRRQKRLSKSEAQELLASAGRLHYQRRSWPEIFSSVNIAPKRLEAVRGWCRAAPDIKREDAVACVEAAAAFVQGGGHAPSPGKLRAVPSHARHRQLLQSPSITPGGEVEGARVLERLRARDDAAQLREAGMRTLALAAFARTLGVTASRAELDGERARLLKSARARPEQLGLDAGQLDRLAEARCLERFVIDNALRLFPDGPSDLEALAFGARVTGQWREEAEAAVKRRK